MCGTTYINLNNVTLQSLLNILLSGTVATIALKQEGLRYEVQGGAELLDKYINAWTMLA